MPWTASVPFDAGNSSRCRGCDATIGWIRTEDDRPHPVDMKGWHGVPCGEGTPGSHRGLTLDGERLSVREPAPPRDSLFGVEPVKQDLVVVWPSHFSSCPKRDRFYAAARQRERA